MHSPSRRAFLHGRRLSKTPWGQFCQRLRRAVSGEFVEFNIEGSAGSGRLTAQHATDVHHARALCAEYGVVLALDGLSMPTRHDDQPMVWVRPGNALGRFQQMETDGNRWFIQPGCTLGELVAAGFSPFHGLPPNMTVAAWLADRTLSDYAIGQTARSGVEHACVLLGDGNTVTLGPFGEENAKPLDGLRLQQMVPELFRLAAGAEAKSCLQARFWPSRYRLDALMGLDGQAINLAHLCLGHGGDLGWVEWVVIDADRLDPVAGTESHFNTEQLERDGLGAAASSVDWKVKSLFDPDSVFPNSGQDL